MWSFTLVYTLLLTIYFQRSLALYPFQLRHPSPNGVDQRADAGTTTTISNKPSILNRYAGTVSTTNVAKIRRRKFGSVPYLATSTVTSHISSHSIEAQAAQSTVTTEEKKDTPNMDLSAAKDCLRQIAVAKRLGKLIDLASSNCTGLNTTGEHETSKTILPVPKIPEATSTQCGDPENSDDAFAGSVPKWAPAIFFPVTKRIKWGLWGFWRKRGLSADTPDKITPSSHMGSLAKGCKVSPGAIKEVVLNHTNIYSNTATGEAASSTSIATLAHATNNTAHSYTFVPQVTVDPLSAASIDGNYPTLLATITPTDTPTSVQPGKSHLPPIEHSLDSPFCEALQSMLRIDPTENAKFWEKHFPNCFAAKSVPSSAQTHPCSEDGTPTQPLPSPLTTQSLDLVLDTYRCKLVKDYLENKPIVDVAHIMLNFLYCFEDEFKSLAPPEKVGIGARDVPDETIPLSSSSVPEISKPVIGTKQPSLELAMDTLQCRNLMLESSPYMSLVEKARTKMRFIYCFDEKYKGLAPTATPGRQPSYHNHVHAVANFIDNWFKRRDLDFSHSRLSAKEEENREPILDSTAEFDASTPVEQSQPTQPTNPDNDEKEDPASEPASISSISEIMQSLNPPSRSSLEKPKSWPTMKTPAKGMPRGIDWAKKKKPAKGMPRTADDSAYSSRIWRHADPDWLKDHASSRRVENDVQTGSKKAFSMRTANPESEQGPESSHSVLQSLLEKIQGGVARVHSIGSSLWRRQQEESPSSEIEETPPMEEPTDELPVASMKDTAENLCQRSRSLCYHAWGER